MLDCLAHRWSRSRKRIGRRLECGFQPRRSGGRSSRFGDARLGHARLFKQRRPSWLLALCRFFLHLGLALLVHLVAVYPQLVRKRKSYAGCCSPSRLPPLTYFDLSLDADSRLNLDCSLRLPLYPHARGLSLHERGYCW
ncbi:hypothetical protein BDV93DRAFT_151115 [Ceratobasidium sp. AG-I]|nr:hypothetical protein BDV93DRAFT_151115 [Ceratobasidium sp. AG-I]